jgi:LmbE family N-acetylglucosaminyl deacetylase
MNSPDTEMLKNSIVISAHPDDEILWFGSILESVKEITVCFLGCKSNLHWKDGREKSIHEYPFRKIACLGVDESETYDSANWHDPIATKYGLEISRKGISDKLYKENYFALKSRLKNKLMGYSHVFTHNPWGEYGNEEHVQVYRVVRDLKEEMGFDLWFPSICSNKSFKLMSKYVDALTSEHVTFKTNKAIASDIKSLYEKNRCWTWYEDWEWFEEETFIKDRNIEKVNEKYGKTFPLNFIKMKIANESRDWAAQEEFRKYRMRIFKNLRNRGKKWLSRYGKEGKYEGCHNT